MRSRHRLNINVMELVRIIGFLILVEAMFMLVPFFYSLITDKAEVEAFAISIAANVVVGLSIVLTVKPRVKELGKRDGMLLTALVWVIFSLFGMLPFMLSEMRLSIVEAFFESMSGFTTTGVSVLENIEDVPRGVNLWRCLMQWLGGVGIIIFTVALLPMLNSSGGMQMFNAEATGITHDKIRPRVSQTAKRLWAIYGVLTATLGVILWIGPLPMYEAVCQSLSTVSTGGFNSCSGESAEAWATLGVRIPVIIFMFLGGVNFVLIYRASLGQVRRALSDAIFRGYVVVILLSTLFIVGVVLSDGETDLEKILVEPLFQVVSAITSTGYSVDSVYTWGKVIAPVLMALMLMGACAGSTSGGLKLDRVIFLLKSAKNEIKKVVHPNRYYPLTVNGVVKPPELALKVAVFFVVYLALLMISGLVVSILGMSVDDAYFAVFSCLGNAGLGFGETASSYASVPDAGKLVLSFIMLVGRLELFTVLILFTRSFWRR